MPAQPVVELSGVRKDFGSTRALDDLSLAVRPGEVVAVLGPNGAGKTTAVNLMLGLRRPTRGTVKLFGRQPTELAARQRCGVMLQESGVPETLTVTELVRLFRSYYPRQLAVEEALRRAGLEGQGKVRYSALSGGQRQRLFYALAICGDPEALFLDEPTAGMDVERRRIFLADLKAWAAAGRTIILTTHYLEEADQLADRILVIDRGRLVADAAPAAIKSMVAGKKIEIRFRGPAPGELLERLCPGHVRVEGDLAHLLSTEPVPVLRRLLAEAGEAVIDLDVSGADLEEAFLFLTSGADGRAQ